MMVVSYYFVENIVLGEGVYPLRDYRSFPYVIVPSRFLKEQVKVGPSKPKWSHCCPMKKAMCLYVSCKMYYDVTVVISVLVCLYCISFRVALYDHVSHHLSIVHWF